MYVYVYMTKYIGSFKLPMLYLLKDRMDRVVAMMDEFNEL